MKKKTKKTKKQQGIKYVFPLGPTGRTQLAVYLPIGASPRVVKVRWDKNFETESVIRVWQ